jgi:WD40 repeat protein
MAKLRQGCALVLSVVLSAFAGRADDLPSASSPALFDRPVLVVDPNMHTAAIRAADVDAAYRWLVTGSVDNTVRVWSLSDGMLLRTERLASGPGFIGTVFGVAISPDGAVIAADTATDVSPQIDLINRATGEIVRTIDDVKTLHPLRFSPDGRFLVAGRHIFDRLGGWTEVASVTQPFDPGLIDAVFSAGGQLATAAADGNVRLYSGKLKGELQPSAETFVWGGPSPASLAFSPDGTRLAIGYSSSTTVSLMDGHSLAPLPGPNVGGIGLGGLPVVTWSIDGKTLLAAGTGDRGNLIFSWGDEGAGPPQEVAAGSSSVSRLWSLPDGDLLLVGAPASLARLQADGKPRWRHDPAIVDFGSRANMLLSDDGTRVDFTFGANRSVAARFDLKRLALTTDPPHDNRMVAAQDGSITQ